MVLKHFLIIGTTELQGSKISKMSFKILTTSQLQSLKKFFKKILVKIPLQYQALQKRIM